MAQRDGLDCGVTERLYASVCFSWAGGRAGEDGAACNVQWTGHRFFTPSLLQGSSKHAMRSHAGAAAAVVAVRGLSMGGGRRVGLRKRIESHLFYPRSGGACCRCCKGWRGTPTGKCS